MLNCAAVAGVVASAMNAKAQKSRRARMSVTEWNLPNPESDSPMDANTCSSEKLLDLEGFDYFTAEIAESTLESTLERLTLRMGSRRRTPRESVCLTDILNHLSDTRSAGRTRGGPTWIDSPQSRCD